MLNRFRSDPLRAQVEEAVQAGTGLRKGEWLLPEGSRSAEDIAAIADAITQWCREQMRGTRTPYGIDQMGLAVACAVPGGRSGGLGDIRGVPAGGVPARERGGRTRLGIRPGSAAR
jgi:hypothetical protein